MYLEISNPMDYHVALYIRLSKEDETEGPSQSVTNQKSLLKEFVQQHHLSVYDIYVDDGWSGTNFERPDFQRMIKDIEAKLSNAQVIDVTKMPNNGRVIFGATVTVLNLDSDEEQTYRIVGDDEADFKQNLISVNSPIARGLIGKEEDDVVVIKTPGGEVEFEVIKVEYL